MQQAGHGGTIADGAERYQCDDVLALSGAFVVLSSVKKAD